MKTIILLLALLNGPAPSGEKPLAKQAERIYSEFLSCSQETNYRCRTYTSELISTVYDIENLKTSTGFMSNALLAQHIEKSEDWTLMGPAYRSEVLAKAQEMANEDKAVVAVYKDEIGQLMHVAVVLPGELTASGTWGMQVPNSVSLAVYDSDHSYLNKGLSYAFKKHMLLRVEIYAYN